MSTRKIGLGVLAVLVATAVMFGLGYGSTGGQPTPKQKVVIHLSQYSFGSHAVLMAVHFARHLQENGSDVTLLLDVEGVRLADQRHMDVAVTGINADIAGHYDAFVKAGGKVLVCPHCAGSSGLTAQYLRPGARIGKNLGELAEVLLAADKTLDY